MADQVPATLFIDDFHGAMLVALSSSPDQHKCVTQAGLGLSVVPWLPPPACHVDCELAEDKFYSSLITGNLSPDLKYVIIKCLYY
jgi:hypothetical protein